MFEGCELGVVVLRGWTPKTVSFLLVVLGKPTQKGVPPKKQQHAHIGRTLNFRSGSPRQKVGGGPCCPQVSKLEVHTHMMGGCRLSVG